MPPQWLCTAEQALGDGLAGHQHWFPQAQSTVPSILASLLLIPARVCRVGLEVHLQLLALKPGSPCSGVESGGRP